MRPPRASSAICACTDRPHEIVPPRKEPALPARASPLPHLPCPLSLLLVQGHGPIQLVCWCTDDALLAFWCSCLNCLRAAVVLVCGLARTKTKCRS